MVDSLARLSRINFQPSIVSICEFRVRTLWWGSVCSYRSPIIDTFLATVLALLFLEAALLPAESASRVSKDSIVSSIIRKWTRHSDN